MALLRKRLNVPTEDGNENTSTASLSPCSVSRRVTAPMADGPVGAGTRRLLNGQAPAQPRLANPAKVRLILLNMERWRWLPHDLGSFYVNVNIPEFTLRVMSDGKPVHTARVVVGKPDKQTPIFSKDMQEIVFNPFGTCRTRSRPKRSGPSSSRREDGSVAAAGTPPCSSGTICASIYGGREVDPARIDWNHVDIRSLNIYQPPGPDNVLGNVKFVFPNKHDVYMHDTHAEDLFAKPVRAESHGCMRVQNPDQLAASLLKEDQGWSYGAGRVGHPGGSTTSMLRCGRRSRSTSPTSRFG